MINCPTMPFFLSHSWITLVCRYAFSKLMDGLVSPLNAMPNAAKNKRGRPVDADLATRRRNQILDAAARLFARHGYAEADTQLLSEAMKIGKGTLYRYFPSKEKLFHAVVERGLEQLRHRIDGEVASISDPLEIIQHAIHVFLNHFAEHPELVELFVQEMAHFKPRQKPAYFAHHEAHSEPWRQMYKHMVEQGRVRNVLGDEDDDVVNDLLYGIILANYVAGRKVSPEAQARRVIDLLFFGILSDSERKKQSASVSKRKTKTQVKR